MPLSKSLSLFAVSAASLAIGLTGCGTSSVEPKLLSAAERPAEPSYPEPPKKEFLDLSFLAGHGELTELEVKLTARAAPTSAAVVQEEYVNLSIFHADGNVPTMLATPYTDFSALSYCQAMTQLELQRQADVQWLESIEAEQLPDADELTVQAICRKRESLLSRLRNQTPTRIRNSLTATLNGLTLDIELLETFIDRNDAATPTNVTTMLRRDSALAQLTMLTNTAIVVERLLAKPSSWEMQKQKIVAMAKRNQLAREQLGDTFEIPHGINDDRLQSAAFDLLSQWESPRIEWITLLVATESKTTEAVHYQVTDNGLAEFNCRWETFSAMTIEQVADGERAIFIHDLIRYEQAPHSIPTGKWHLVKRRWLAPIHE